VLPHQLSKRLAAGLVPVALLLGFLGVARAQVELPAPADRSVHDFAGVLSSEAVSTMERFHKELFDKTGVAVVVITVPRLEDEPIEDFAVRVGQEWGVGKKGEDRGIVVALAIEDRRVFIATGYGVEGYLPDGRVGRILDQYAIPSLRRNDWSTAMLQTSGALVQASASEYGVSVAGTESFAPARRSREREDPGPFGVVFGILFMLLMVYLLIRHPALFFWLLLSGRGGGRGGFGGGGFGGGSGFGGFGGGGFGGGGAGRSF
jgi:uncharacterized protein